MKIKLYHCVCGFSILYHHPVKGDNLLSWYTFLSKVFFYTSQQVEKGKYLIVELPEVTLQK